MQKGTLKGGRLGLWDDSIAKTLLKLSDLLLYFAGNLLNLPFCFELWVVDDFAGHFLHFASGHVSVAPRDIFVTRFHDESGFLTAELR